MAIDFQALIQECAIETHPTVMQALVKTESGFNPFAIGVVDGYLKRQPKNKAEAIATAKNLQALKYNFSLGVAQVNRYNLNSYGLDYESAFDACPNLQAGSKIFNNCYTRALTKFSDENHALKAAMSCYYSGNFKTGFAKDLGMNSSYVQRVSNNIEGDAKPIEVIPSKPKKTVKVKPVDNQPTNETQLPTQPSEKPKPAEWDVFQDFKSI